MAILAYFMLRNLYFLLNLALFTLASFSTDVTCDSYNFSLFIYLFTFQPLPFTSLQEVFFITLYKAKPNLVTITILLVLAFFFIIPWNLGISCIFYLKGLFYPIMALDRPL
jgi:hypothetical protein